jgi:pimeloyl-ACP methyl ester carboxylesterase
MGISRSLLFGSWRGLKLREPVFSPDYCRHLRSEPRRLLAHWFLSLFVSLGFTVQGQEEPKGHSFDSKGVTIHYTIDGKGDPVLLIHGLYSSGQVNWRAPGIIKALSANHQVIAMDVRGHGASDKPEQADAYGMAMVDDVVRLLDHLGIKKAHVIGYSMGGMITMKLLTTHPERVKSAVLGGMGWLREGSPLQNFWEELPERKGRGTPSACARSFGALAVTEAQVKAIHVPVKIVVGDRDPVRKLYVEPLEAVRQDWPVSLVPDAGHINCIAKPAFKDNLRKWLDEQSKR